LPLYACCSAAAASAWARCSAASRLEGLKAVLVDPGDQRGVVLAHDVALDHNVDAVDIQVLQDARVVRDDEHGAVAALAVGVHAMADGGKGVDVQAGVGFVQDGELGLQQQKLEHLDLLLLAAREAHAQLAVEIGGIHVELGRELLHAAAELLTLHLQAGAAGDAGAQKARQRHARNLDRGLEAQEQAGARALVGGALGVAAGETHVLMGPNGAGKSTLGHLIMGE